jgi:hypothetical protein
MSAEEVAGLEVARMALPTIRFHGVLGVSLTANPIAKCITVIGLVESGYSAMTFSLRKSLQMRKALFPKVRKRMPRPTRQ